MKPHFQRLLKHCHYIGTVRSGHKVEGAADFLYELIAPCCCFFVHVYFVCNHHAGNVRAVFSKFFVPILQILIGNFAICVEDQYADVGAVVVSWV